MTAKEQRLLQLDRILPEVQKPARYTGGEVNSVMKEKEEVEVRFAFCFPDTYEIGMSHLGMKILYARLNELPYCWCERVFTPWEDMEEKMRANGISLYGLESMDPLTEFDIIGFTLQYEMSYTTVLHMLDLAGIPLYAKDREDLSHLVVAGGPCVCNPEPLADFVDLCMPGEGEEVIVELVALYRTAKAEGWSKTAFLEAACKIEGIYVPAFYDVTYHEDGTVAAITLTHGVPTKVKKRIIQDFDQVYYPETFVVPQIDTVHDRAVLEILRGCIRGCRFCQAGFLYRPLREKQADTLCRQGLSLCDTTGYDEMSLSSLSSSDYSQLEPLLDGLLDATQERMVSLTLPSLRIDNFSESLLEKIQRVRKSGLTFAPEAGTQRMRDVINKNIEEEDILSSCKTAFAGGYQSVKLYFMLGLPTETKEDCEAIMALAQRIVDLYYDLPNRPKGKPVQVTVSTSVFVPKPFTPFQWFGQDELATVEQKQQWMKDAISSKRISFKYHDGKTSRIEAVLARGDRRLGKVLYRLWEKGCKLESWDEFFDYELWVQTMEECGLSVDFYANRHREVGELFPWSHLDYGISETFLRREWDKAQKAQTTPHCRKQCSGCGANQWSEGGVCVATTYD